jgi:hypothetical protein
VSTTERILVWCLTPLNATTQNLNSNLTLSDRLSNHQRLFCLQLLWCVRLYIIITIIVTQTSVLRNNFQKKLWRKERCVRVVGKATPKLPQYRTKDGRSLSQRSIERSQRSQSSFLPRGLRPRQHQTPRTRPWEKQLQSQRKLGGINNIIERS